MRVPLGWALGLSALYLARPTPALYALGLSVAALGGACRLWAAGHLTKWKGLTRSGPYAWTRNPLYFGSLLVGIGFAVAGARWEVGVLLALYLAFVYRPVIQMEAERLAEKYPAEYPDYARAVPLFFPRVPKVRTEQPAFSWERVLENREHISVLGWLGGAFLLWLKMSPWGRGGL